MTYRTIVADPPWIVAERMGSGGRRTAETFVPYAMLDVDAICALQVAALADTDAWLFLWSTRREFREGNAVKVARAWGFEPCGEMIWGLRNPGLGSPYLANDHEPILVARRGSPEPLATDNPIGVMFWRQVYRRGRGGVPAKVHSAKPEGFYDWCEQVAPAPRLELFARRQRLGWVTWGNECFNAEGISL